MLLAILYYTVGALEWLWIKVHFTVTSWCAKLAKSLLNEGTVTHLIFSRRNKIEYEKNKFFAEARHFFPLSPLFTFPLYMHWRVMPSVYSSSSSSLSFRWRESEGERVWERSVSEWVRPCSLGSQQTNSCSILSRFPPCRLCSSHPPPHPHRRRRQVLKNKYLWN